MGCRKQSERMGCGARWEEAGERGSERGGWAECRRNARDYSVLG